MKTKFDHVIWEYLEDFSGRIESLITSIENNVGESEARSAAIQKLNEAYQDIVQASQRDQEYRDRQK